MLFQCSIQNQTGYVYSFIEGQSTPDRFLPIRISMYNHEVIKWHWENIKKEIPPIINFVVYNGRESPYPYEINFMNMLKKYNISDELFYNGTILLDLNSTNDSDIEKNHKIGLLELLLKHGRDNDFYEYLLQMKKNGKFIILTEGYSIEPILRFVEEMLKRNKIHNKKILELFLGINDKIDNEIMTFTESIKKEAFDQGISQGISQGVTKGIGIGIDQEKVNIAKRLFKYGASIELIKKSTNLSDQELEKILLLLQN